MPTLSLNSDGGRFGTTLVCTLASTGVSKEDAAKYGAFAMEMHRYLSENKEVGEAVMVLCDSYSIYDGSKKIFTAAKYLRNQAAVGLTSASAGLTAYGTSGAASILLVFHSRFSALAERQGIELNKCALAFADLSLNIAAAGAGSVTALSGFGIALAGIGIVGTWTSSQALVKACSSAPTSN
jgi:hypothetical protein